VEEPKTNQFPKLTEKNQGFFSRADMICAILLVMVSFWVLGRSNVILHARFILIDVTYFKLFF
jgi:hypothetical protein